MSDENEKEDQTVNTMAELTILIDSLIASGRRDMKIHFGMDLLINPDAYIELERLAFEHPHTKDAEEIVSYSKDALQEQEHRGFHYKVERGATGYKAMVHSGCGGWVQAYDVDFPDIGDADLHARGYIDGAIAEGERSAAATKALRKTNS